MAKTTTRKKNTSFDLKTEATRSLYAGAGAADLAVAAVRDYAITAQSTAQKTVAALKPKALRDQAVVAVNTGVEAVTEEAKARRAELQALPGTIQARVNENVTEAEKTYSDLVERGERVVKRVRNQPETQEAVGSAKTATVKAKTTRTQAKKAAGTATKSAASTRRTIAKKAAPAKSSAKGAVTSAAKTATATAKATQKAVDQAGTNAS